DRRGDARHGRADRCPDQLSRRATWWAQPMKLKLSLALPQGGTHDLTLSCDITATVGDAARALIRAGASGDPRLETLALHRLAPVTLRGRPGGDARMLLLDPCAPLGSSGLQSGWTVEPVPEFGPRGEGRRL